VLPAELVSGLVVTADDEPPAPDVAVPVAEPDPVAVAEPPAPPALPLTPVKPVAARPPAPVAVPEAVRADVAGSAPYVLLGPEAAPAQKFAPYWTIFVTSVPGGQD